MSAKIVLDFLTQTHHNNRMANIISFPLPKRRIALITRLRELAYELDDLTELLEYHELLVNTRMDDYFETLEEFESITSSEDIDKALIQPQQLEFPFVHGHGSRISKKKILGGGG